ncbi:hypothetical protein Tco_0070950 [Tanacetum coccineum]
MSSIDDIKSILTQSGLDELCEKFHIPPTVHSELPGHNSRIRNSPTGKIGVYTRKDPHPTPDEFDANVCDYLADNPTPLRKLPEPFLCFVDIIRIRVVPLAGVNDQGNANVQGAGNDNVNEEGGDKAQAIVADKPKKVRKKRKAADDAGGSGHPPKKLREDHGASGDVGASTAGKSLVALQGLLDSSTLAVEVSVTVAATIPFVTSYVTLTPEREGGGNTDSVTGPNLRTQHATERYVVISDSSHHSSTNAADDEVKAGTEPAPHSIFRDFASTSEANQDVAGPSHPVGTELSADLFFEDHFKAQTKSAIKCGHIGTPNAKST